MSRCRLALAAFMVSACLTACGKHEEAAKAAPPVDANTPAPRVEGSPQIVTSADGVHIEYHVYGSGDPAVILVHGWSCDGNYWSAQLKDLKAKYTLVTVDLAGHGASGSNRTDWSMGNFGEDVAAVARQLQNSKIVLVGHSMGAPVALEASRRIGDRVVGIIAVDSLKTVGQPPVSEPQIQLRLKPFRENFIGHTREFVTSSFFQPGANPAFVQKVAYDMSLEPPDIGIAAMESISRMDFAKLLPEIHVPIVAINSDLGPKVDEARIRKSIPGFRATTLEHTGHFLMMEAPDRFNPLLIKEIDAMASR
ncbi:MAG: alpha/beta hydrolase [Gammaproteobacteria bacterium]